MDTKTISRLTKILSAFEGEAGDLIPILQETQKEFSYLPKEAMRQIARFLKLPESTVYGVSTFYAQFKFTPSAKRTIKVCSGTACHVRGNGSILAEIERILGIKPGETTEDMRYSLETIACFGSCALAPVVVVDKTVYGRVTPEKMAEIIG
ncbi:MAG: NADH-quinone oxidoreductase subunit NuoE [Chloroflexota bacterium]